MRAALAAFLILASTARSAAADVRDLVAPGPDRDVPMRCYANPGEDPRPVIAILHGGRGYEAFRAQYESHSSALVNRGYRVCAILYYSKEDLRVMNGSDREARQARYQTQFNSWVGAANQAVDYLSHLATTTSGGVGVLGFSQGAFLAVAVAGTNSNARALVEFYGGVPSTAQNRIVKLPPTFIVHGDADKVVSVQEAYALKEFVEVKAPNYGIQIYPGAGHGFDANVNDARAIDAKQKAIEFFSAHLPSSSK